MMKSNDKSFFGHNASIQTRCKLDNLQIFVYTQSHSDVVFEPFDIDPRVRELLRNSPARTTSQWVLLPFTEW